MEKSLRSWTLAFTAAIVGIGTSLAQAQALKPLTVGWGPFADVPQISVAAAKNLFKDDGLDVKVIPFNSGRESVEALIGGQLDMAIVAEFPVVVGAMRKQKFAMIAGLTKYQANRIIATDKIALQSVKDLAGKKIGTTVGTNIHYLLDLELRNAGVTAEIVNIAPPDIVPALVRGDIDAAVMFPNAYPAAKRTLGDRYRELRTKAYGTNFVLIATPEVIEKRPDLCAKFLSTLLKAEGIVLKSPAESQEAVAQVVGKALTLDAIKAGWPDYEFRVKLDRDLVNLLVKEGEWVRARGMVKDVEPTEALFRGYVNEGALKSVAADRVTLQ